MVVNGSNSRLAMDIGRAAESARVTSSRCPDSSGAVYLIQWVRRVTSKVDIDGIPCSWTNPKHPGMAKDFGISPTTNPMMWGWDWDHQTYEWFREGYGSLG